MDKPRILAIGDSPSDPDPDAPAVRRFRVAAHASLAKSLAELRNRIDEIDQSIVALLAERASCVRDAARFKRDHGEVAAPTRQAEVFARVRKLAERDGPDFPDLPDLVEAAYRVLVAGFVATEQRLFDDTEPIEPET